MNLITRDTDYAVRALCYMAQKPGKVVSAKELCEQFSLPKPYLRRILQSLARSGILQSRRGQGGGFELKHDPTQVRLADLMEVFQGAFDFTRCTFRASVCSHQGSCPLRQKVKQIEKNALAELRATTIASLLTAS